MNNENVIYAREYYSAIKNAVYQLQKGMQLEDIE